MVLIVTAEKFPEVCGLFLRWWHPWSPEATLSSTHLASIDIHRLDPYGQLIPFPDPDPGFEWLR